MIPSGGSMGPSLYSDIIPSDESPTCPDIILLDGSIKKPANDSVVYDTVLAKNNSNNKLSNCSYEDTECALKHSQVSHQVNPPLNLSVTLSG